MTRVCVEEKTEFFDEVLFRYNSTSLNEIMSKTVMSSDLNKNLFKYDEIN